jgi:predicted mannosyl-3-phosphoglycerate phosphatase (HAD superfamily)
MSSNYEHDLYLLEKEKVKALITIGYRLKSIDEKLNTLEEFYKIKVNEKTREEMRHNFSNDLNDDDEGSNI